MQRRHAVALGGIDVDRLFQQSPYAFRITSLRGIRNATIPSRRRHKRAQTEDGAQSYCESTDCFSIRHFVFLRIFVSVCLRSDQRRCFPAT